MIRGNQYQRCTILAISILSNSAVTVIIIAYGDCTIREYCYAMAFTKSAIMNLVYR